MRNDNLARAIDAYSASPAIRLRYRILAAKTSVRLPQAVSPPPIQHLAEHTGRRHDIASDATGALATLARLRQEAADTVEHLIAFLDDTDGIVDDEDTDEDGDIAGSATDREDDRSDDEPWLGSPEIAPSFPEWSDKWQMWFERQGEQTRWAAGSTDSAEIDDGDEEDGGDNEPSLGSLTSGGGSQQGWAALCDGPLDAEGQHDDHEPDDDGEPSLGWTVDGYVGNCNGFTFDRELDGAAA